MKALSLEVVKSVEEEINERHVIACQSVKNFAEESFRIGKLLVEERKKYKHGKWIPWLQAHINFTSRTAQNYMRAYREKCKNESVSFLLDGCRLTLPNSKKKKIGKSATKSLTVRVPGNRQVTIKNALASWRNIERANTENQSMILCSKCWTYFSGATPLSKDATKLWSFQCECEDSLVTAESESQK